MFPTRGTWLQAIDCTGKHWYEAKVVDERGEGDAREVKVHFKRFHARYDEWITAASGKLAPLDETTPDTHEVEKIVAKRTFAAGVAIAGVMTRGRRR